MAAYAPVPGIPAFRDLWEKWILKKYEVSQNLPTPNRNIQSFLTKPVICNGITNAIFLMSKMFLEPGENIVCPNKRWGNYNLVLSVQNGLNIIPFEFFEGQKFNLASMLQAMNKSAENQDKVVLILNFPNNPTGYCPSTEEAKNITESLVEFCETNKKSVIVLCDDAYEGFVYDSTVVSHSLFYELVNRHPMLIPIKMDGTSKEMLMYGGRIASITLGISSKWVNENEIANLKLEWDNKIQGMVRSTISNSNRLAQEILSEYLNDGFELLLKEHKEIEEILCERYDATLKSFGKYSYPNLTMDPAAGGFFVFINVKGVSATKFADHLVSKYKVGVFPMENSKSAVNGIRFAFCSVPAVQIDECFRRIYQTMLDLS